MKQYNTLNRAAYGENKDLLDLFLLKSVYDADSDGYLDSSKIKPKDATSFSSLTDNSTLLVNLGEIDTLLTSHSSAITTLQNSAIDIVLSNNNTWTGTNTYSSETTFSDYVYVNNSIIFDNSETNEFDVSCDWIYLTDKSAYLTDYISTVSTAATTTLKGASNIWTGTNKFNNILSLDSTYSIRMDDSTSRKEFSDVNSTFYIENVERVVLGDVSSHQIGTASTVGGLLMVEADGYYGLFMLSNGTVVKIADPETKFGTSSLSAYCNVYYAVTDYFVENNSGGDSTIKYKFVTLSEL